MSALVHSLQTHFAILPEPRRRKVRKHPLLNILFIALCALLSGADTFTDIAQWARNHHDWLKERLDLQNGIPSHDTIRRVFALLEPTTFSACFLAWTQALTMPAQSDQDEPDKQISLDGKTIRASFDSVTGQKAIHLVRAWSSEQRIVLDQEKVEEKSNEIMAIPALLSRLDVTGCLVSIDAMGCHKAIAGQIVQQKGDYLLSLKENHPILYERALENLADWQEKKWQIPFVVSFAKTVEKARGRVEIRRCWLVESGDFLDVDGEWASLYGVALVQREIHHGKTLTLSQRLYLTSVRKASLVLRGSRHHWGIENALHWVLDVVFLEDRSRVRKAKAGVNLSILRQVCASVLRRERSSGLSLRAKRKEASWNVRFLETLLTPGRDQLNICD